MNCKAIVKRTKKGFKKIDINCSSLKNTFIESYNSVVCC